MNKSLNLSIIEGRLTRDPELYYTKNGNAICKFDLAVNYSFKVNGKDFSEVSFISVTCWNKTADACSKYLTKGSKVRVHGRLKQDFWMTSDGQKKTKIHIEASAVDFISAPQKKEDQITA